MASLAQVTPDLVDVWRAPVDGDESDSWQRLLNKASDLLLTRAPWVQVRLDNGTLTTDAVAAVVCNAVKSFLQNPSGASSESVGPFSVSYRSGKTHEAGGTLGITEEAVNSLRSRTRRGLGSIRTRPGLAPIHIGGFALEPFELNQADPDAFPYGTTVDPTTDCVVDGGEVIGFRAGYDHNDNA